MNELVSQKKAYSSPAEIILYINAAISNIRTDILGNLFDGSFM